MACGAGRNIHFTLAFGKVAACCMRRRIGMDQKEYARIVAGISSRILAEFENGEDEKESEKQDPFGSCK